MVKGEEIWSNFFTLMKTFLKNGKCENVVEVKSSVKFFIDWLGVTLSDNDYLDLKVTLGIERCLQTQASFMNINREDKISEHHNQVL